MDSRKAFKFYRSYYDVALELPESDRLSYLMAILHTQFTGHTPELSGMAKFAFISQKHSIQSQLDGFLSKTGSSIDPNQPPSIGASVQEKEKEKEKEKNTAGDKSPTLAERQKEFYNSLVPYTNQYSKTMVREFYEYWTEHSANGKKMRFEKEKVFDTARRLKTWAARAREEPKVLTTTQNYTGAEVDFKNMNRDAWEKIYEYSLKTDNEFRKHFNYAELQKGTPMGINN